MTVEKAITECHIDRIDAELMLARVLKKDRVWLMAHKDNPLSQAEEFAFASFAERRKQHEPIAYILGEKEFYGCAFIVDCSVLIPRPSTETLIDEVKYLFDCKFQIESPRITEADTDIAIVTYLKNQAQTQTLTPTLVDIGTGSGCIAVTLALEIPDVRIIATDVSEDALNIAKENAEQHGVSVRITFINENIFHSSFAYLSTNNSCPAKPWRSRDKLTTNNFSPFLLVSNPPYIPSGEPLAQDIANYEPHEALFSGLDGMDMIRHIAHEYAKNPNCLGWVMEMRKEQADILMQEAFHTQNL